jgi:hypothetical protein
MIFGITLLIDRFLTLSFLLYFLRFSPKSVAKHNTLNSPREKRE